jgi:hypothetical protein
MVEKKKMENAREIFRVTRISIYFALIVMFAIVFKVIYTFGVMTIIRQGIPPIQALLDAILNLGREGPKTAHRSLYQSFVEWYYASSWALIPGASIYYALKSIVRLFKEFNERFPITLTLWVTGILTLGLGFLFYLSGGSYATVYPAYFFLIPFIVEKLKKRKAAQMLLVILILATSPLAAMDPMLNPIIYNKIDPMNNPATTSDYIEGKTIALHIQKSQNFKYWLLEYRIGAVISTLAEEYGLANMPAAVGSVRGWQLYEKLQFNCSIEPGVLYIYRPELLACSIINNKEDVNIVYSSVRTEAIWGD